DIEIQSGPGLACKGFAADLQKNTPIFGSFHCDLHLFSYLAHISLPYGPWPWVVVGGTAYADVNGDIDLEFLAQLVGITVTTEPRTE
ncbi:MAG: hypothetical protein II276_03070, partial [Bacteroidales bacterium]|nr:hypothetical protein [Bacteroidales bacterium]